MRADEGHRRSGLGAVKGKKIGAAPWVDSGLERKLKGRARMADCAAEGAVDQGARSSAIPGSSWWTGQRFRAPSVSARHARLPRWPNAWRHTARPHEDVASEGDNQVGFCPGRGLAFGCMNRESMRYSHPRLGQTRTEIRNHDYERPPT